MGPAQSGLLVQIDFMMAMRIVCLLAFSMVVMNLYSQNTDSLGMDDFSLPQWEDWENNESAQWCISIHARDLSPLLQLPHVKHADIEAIQTYIQNNGKLMHVHELYQIPNLSDSCILQLIPHVIVSGKPIIGQRKSYIAGRYKKTSNGLTVLKTQSLLQLTPQLVIGGQWQSGYAQYRKNNTECIVGDFSPIMGQGFVGSSPAIGNLGWGFTQIIKPAMRIKPYTSSIPLQQWRGIGITHQMNHWKWLLAIPGPNPEKEKILATQFKGKQHVFSMGILHHMSTKIWIQETIPLGNHLLSYEGVLEKNLAKNGVSAVLVINKHIRAKWQSQWESTSKSMFHSAVHIGICEWTIKRGHQLLWGITTEQTRKTNPFIVLNQNKKCLAQYVFEPFRYAKFYIRYQLHYADSIDPKWKGQHVFQQWRADGVWKADEDWTLHARAEIHDMSGITSVLAFQDVEWHPLGKPYRLSFRYANFHSLNWEGRIYAMEKETQGSFYIPAYSGSGERIYILAQYKKPHFQLQCKWGWWYKRQPENIPMDVQIFLKFIF